MTDTSQHDEPAESGALEPEHEGGTQPGAGEQQESAEGGGLDAESQGGKGYGADEGEREEALPDE